MGRIGLSDQFFLPKNIEWEGSFYMQQKTQISKDDIPCSEDPSYSFRDCVLTWVAADAGCHLDWFSQPPGKAQRCYKREQIGKYSESLTKALQARWLQLSNMTGCIPKCTVRSYSLVEKSREEANWGRNWSASFYMDVKTSSYTHQTEFFAYDIWDLTAGLGGLMGIFLGWSFLYIIIQLYMVLENTCINFFV